MRLLHQSTVAADEIDGLGHLNVRFYLSRAQAANRALLAMLGLDGEAVETLSARLVPADSYTRYHREQFEGAELSVRGGVLEAHGDAVRAYFELLNEAKGEVAATFIIKTALADRATRRPLPLPARLLAEAPDALVTLPERGRPRTADLGLPRTDLSFDDVAGRLGEEGPDPFSRQLERTIEPEACDEYGFLSDSEDFMFGALRQQRPGEGERWGPPTFKTDEGHRFGWASLETRNLRLSQPRAGETIRSVGGEIGLHDKVRHSRRWIFNVTSGAVVSMNDNIALALDLDARRPIAIPLSVRGDLEKRFVPELA